MGFDIPKIVWSSRDVSYSHLKVFECKAFACVSKEQRQKLYDKAIPCIFLGYKNVEFGYKLWDPKKRRVIKSKDVVFHERQTMLVSDGSETSEQGGKVDLTPVTPARRIAIEGVDLDNELRVDDELAIKYGDDEGVEQEKQLLFRRSNKEHQSSRRYHGLEYIFIINEGKPGSFAKVEIHKDKFYWRKVM